MNSPYRRHSVWIDVFGILALGAFLLGLLGILTTEMMSVGGGSSGGGGAAVAGGGAPPVPQVERGLRTRRSGSSSRGLPIVGGKAPATGGSDAEVPFSDGWQERATPDLSGPTGTGEVPSGGGALRGETPEPSGPTVASRTRSSDGGPERGGRGGPESDWQGEARHLSGRARALSNQLGQIERSAAEQDGGGREGASKAASGGRETASTSADPGTPDNPDQVPIGDHLHWLAVLGVLWGAWRIGRGV